METTLTTENLKAIYNAMGKIQEIDQSQYFKQYLDEVETRIKESSSLNEYLKYEQIQQNTRAKNRDSQGKT
jgi:hypothetical protein